jgi:hypothetical protein
MEQTPTTFDHVFKTWLENELEPTDARDILKLARSKKFNSIAEWRLATAMRLGLDRKDWFVSEIENPNDALPKVIIGPFKGWSIHFENKLTTSFEQALEIDAFFQWCQGHNRIPRIAQDFPLPTQVILLQKPNGDLIHIEGGHRICAVAYAKKIGKPIDFAGKPPVTAAIAQVTEEEIATLQDFLKRGTDKQ